MANQKISELPAATTPLDGTEIVPLVQAGITSSISVTDLRGASSGWNFGSGFNVRDYGLVGDGVTDDRAALNTLLNTTAPAGSTIYFPQGTYKIGSAITVNTKKFRIIGDYAIIMSTGNYAILTVLGSNDWVIDGLEFVCSVYGGSAVAISFSSSGGSGGGGFRISNCKFKSFAIGVYPLGTQGAVESRGAVISNCRFMNNDYGIYCGNYGEYITVIGCTIMGCPNAGLYLPGGNFLITGNQIVENFTGVKVVNGNNNGHGTISNNLINHHTGGYALDIQDTILGATISDNAIFDGSLLIANTSYVNITGGQMQIKTITSTNNTNLFFSNIMFMSGYSPNSFSSTGTAPKFFACFGDLPSGATNVFSF